MPNVPSATTVKPMTEPLENAIRRAEAKLERAAWVVRTAAAVAVRIPIHPAVADKHAPTRKAIAVDRPDRGKNRASTINMIATKPASTVYSTRRNAIAPLRMSAAMRCIRSSPGSCPLINRVNTNANATAHSGAPIPNIQNSCSSIKSPAL